MLRHCSQTFSLISVLILSSDLWMGLKTCFCTSGFPELKFCVHSSHSARVSGPSHSPWFHCPKNIWCRSQRPRGVRRGSAAASLLRLWFQIPLGAWMFVCCECCVLSGTGLCDGLITRPEEPYRVWCVWVWSWILENDDALADWGLLMKSTLTHHEATVSTKQFVSNIKSEIIFNQKRTNKKSNTS
jgi:hypothetical protein